jgi:xanthine permease XanP
MDSPFFDDAEPRASSRPADLIYGLNDRPPLRLSIFVALQHVLAVFVGIVTPPALIARALALPAADGAFLVSMALSSSGIGTLLQTKRVGAVGSGLLNIQGTSFVFVTPIISLAGSIVAAGGSQRHSLGVVFGVCLSAALVPIVLAPFIRLASRVITLLVTGIVVTLIGLTLVNVGIIAAVSFGLGLGVTFVPEICNAMPPLFKGMFSSGIATGGLCALFLNSVLPGKRA